MAMKFVGLGKHTGKGGSAGMSSGEFPNTSDYGLRGKGKHMGRGEMATSSPNVSDYGRVKGL